MWTNTHSYDDKPLESADEKNDQDNWESRSDQVMYSIPSHSLKIRDKVHPNLGPEMNTECLPTSLPCTSLSRSHTMQTQFTH